MNLQKALVLSLALVAGTTASASQGGFQGATLNDNEYIIGGTTVAAKDPVASSTVLILGKLPDGSDSEFICTGSIIDQDLIVTAAHCVDTPAENLRVIFVRDMSGADAQTLMNNGEVLPITGYFANPGWNNDISSDVDNHDIAVIRLDGALPAGYKPATVLKDSETMSANDVLVGSFLFSSNGAGSPKKGDTAVLAGYGITNATTQDGSGTLREVQTKVSSLRGNDEVVIDQRQGRGACHGDSGGPAFAKVNGQLVLWGITSRGYPENAPDDCRHYAVYTRIDAYADWISEVSAKLRSAAAESKAPTTSVTAAPNTAQQLMN